MKKRRTNIQGERPLEIKEKAIPKKMFFKSSEKTQRQWVRTAELRGWTSIK